MGVLSYLPQGSPFFRHFRTSKEPPFPGHTNVKYCYSTWLRHLSMARENCLPTAPEAVAELGPGESLGVGLTALLCGARTYVALDVEKTADISGNLTMLNELVTLLNNRGEIPDDRELPGANPKLLDYGFPSHILSADRLKFALEYGRLAMIRNAILKLAGTAGNIIQFNYVAPWSDTVIIERESVDMIISQAVLEHIDDLEGSYAAMFQWLKPGGFISHVIDFRSHGTSRTWNGHWAYPNFVWNLMRGKRPFLINRYPYSKHRELLKKHGFEIVGEKKSFNKSGIKRGQLAREFLDLTDEDLATDVVFFQALKRKHVT